MNYAELDDETIIRLIARADENAIGELYDRYSRMVFGFALHALGNSDEAEEVTMDVFTRVWNRANSYRSDLANVGTWLTRITRNCTIDRHRRRSVRPEQHSVSWSQMPTHMMPTTGNPEETALLTSQREWVQSAIFQLPPEQQEALALVYFKGYTQQQTADALKQPLGTVKTRIRLAMQKLRVLLVDEDR